MSAEPKPPGTNSGQPEAPMQQMKAIWKRLSDDARDYWREQFSSSRKLSVLRAEILSKFKVRFNHDARLSEFKGWVADQDARDAKAEELIENERRLIEQHPDWSKDQVREEVLRQSYFETLATGNFQKLGLKTVTADLKAKAQSADEQRYIDAKRTDEEKALSLCLEQSKGTPAHDLFIAAFAALKKAKEKK